MTKEMSLAKKGGETPKNILVHLVFILHKSTESS
jgi:hypothetical protein